jgi:V/A-type H+/Na+-transporting ATPase subunit E
MSLETVKEEVLSGAKAESSSLIAEGKKEAARILREAEKKADELRERAEAESKRLIESIRRQETASSELEAKKIVLEAKKELVEEAFAAAAKSLESMDDKKREAIIKKMMAKARKDIDVAHAYCSKKDSKLLKDIKPEASDISGGLIAENKEKTVRVDFSYETLLQSVRETKMQEISAILFS